MKIWPLQFRSIDSSHMVFTDDTGKFFKASTKFLERYATENLSVDDTIFLQQNGHAFLNFDDFQFVGFASRWINRVSPVGDLKYVILVPTLRCDLKCDYCQVSRVAKKARGFDWSEATLRQVISFLSNLSPTEVKIEFQGGEPLLRLDILKTIRSFCRQRFKQAEFVVCTNLQEVSDEAWEFLSADDTQISTSFDGTNHHHQKRRTISDTQQESFEENLGLALARFGSEKVSALPTIDPLDPPEPSELISNYASKGFRTIFLRKVNFQGFARKKYSFEGADRHWEAFYRQFIEELITYNMTADKPVEEFYLSHILRRIVRSGHHNHVDLRNPNWLGKDYVVIDHDGKLYPTDEARMISRVGQIDLSVGDLENGLDAETLHSLNSEASNFDDPDCVHCVYKPYCGPDVVDDLSRYGRIDLPRHETDHCQRHMFLFDLAFELIFSENLAVQKSLANWLDISEFNQRLAPVLS
ncbi:His-Xaa-Ser system radical SAM maturase HxsB [Shimia gijangensis]|uniref:His-Xaa-Ser system radical SAM maturase HxsB n=1 Tax=Shimia gijangensis TaxID=1470563 RepID=A0A1M6TUD4_9RHOB|nr:His-Xaa-Ser system radical SAM maturase HxsB [Shimia gijangensis]SHK60602.1 His-Xaa-Ser system radical SAM maturase HxsB [Shimia gijangensis]